MDYKDAIAIFENNTKRSVVKMKMPIKILFIGLIGCLYVKYRYRLSCQRENTKTIPI